MRISAKRVVSRINAAHNKNCDGPSGDSRDPWCSLHYPTRPEFAPYGAKPQSEDRSYPESRRHFVNEINDNRDHSSIDRMARKTDEQQQGAGHATEDCCFRLPPTRCPRDGRERYSQWKAPGPYVAKMRLTNYLWEKRNRGTQREVSHVSGADE